MCQPSTPTSLVQQTEVCWHPYLPQHQRKRPQPRPRRQVAKQVASAQITGALGRSPRSDMCQPSTPTTLVQQTEVCWHPYLPQHQRERPQPRPRRQVAKQVASAQSRAASTRASKLRSRLRALNHARQAPERASCEAGCERSNTRGRSRDRSHIGFSPTVSSYTCSSFVLSKMSSWRERPVTS